MNSIFNNVITWAINILAAVALAAVGAENMYGPAPAGATDDEKKALRDKKIAFFNENAPKCLDNAVAAGTLPQWLCDVVKKFALGMLAGWVIDAANYNGIFGHDGNPPKAA